MANGVMASRLGETALTGSKDPGRRPAAAGSGADTLGRLAILFECCSGKTVVPENYNWFMRDTTSIGTRAEAMVLTALAQRGFWALLPFGDGRPYDIVVDDGADILRVQCKTGRLIRGAVVFPTLTWCRANKSRSYRGYADYFDVFCPDNGQVYFVPVADVPARTASLRVAAPLNGQTRGLRWARDYVIWPAPVGETQAAAGSDPAAADDRPGSGLRLVRSEAQRDVSLLAAFFREGYSTASAPRRCRRSGPF